MTSRYLFFTFLCLSASFLTSCDQNALHAKAIKDNRAQIERLKTNISRKSRDLKKQKALLHDIASAETEHLTLETSIQKSSKTIISLQDSISEETSAFQAYTDSYRQQTWQNAIGEQYPELKRLDGKAYTNAKIKQITPVGMEITHDEGMARIRYTDLPPTFNERFQWRHEEAKTVLTKEHMASTYMAKMAAKEAPQPAARLTQKTKIKPTHYTLPTIRSFPTAINTRSGYKLNQTRKLATRDTARIKVNRRKSRRSPSTIYYYPPQNNRRSSSNYNCPAPQSQQRPSGSASRAYYNPNNIIRR